MSDVAYTYDYFLAGRWRDHAKLRATADALRAAGKTVYCFINNEYDGDGIKQERTPDAAKLAYNHVEDVTDWQVNPTFRAMYEQDMGGLRSSREFIIVLPAGLSAHMELGVAYGLGKRCVAIGEPEKIETLYLMLDHIYPEVGAFLRAGNEVAV